MENSRKKLGNLGEDLACEHLAGLGHRILDRNWRSGHLEVDIVSIDSEGLHFVEVKSRVAPVSADPLENVGFFKQKNIAGAARRYLHEKVKGELEVFFDVVTVVFDGETTDINYYKQAYLPIYV